MASGKFSVTPKALAARLDAYPNPEDGSPIGPGGPVMAGLHLDWLSLNPQPLPPRAALGHPIPWRAIQLTRGVVRSLLVVHQVAAAAPKSELAREVVANTRSALSTFVDDFCGTRWPHWHIPIPLPGPNPGPEPWPIDLVFAGLQFQQAARSIGGELGGQFDAAAHRRLETGFAKAG